MKIIKLLFYIIAVFIFAGNISAQSTVKSGDINKNLSYELSQNYPNPFNPSTIIKFTLPKASNVTIKVYNMLGQEIKTLINEYKEPGAYSIEFNADNLNTGLYFYKIEAGTFSQVKKMTLLK